MSGKVEKRFLKEIIHFFSIRLILPQTRTKNPAPGGGGHEIYNFGRHFLGQHHYIPGLSDLCLGVE